jgi:hypothetical protein
MITLDLKYFELKDNKLIETDQVLFTEKEIFFMLDSKKDGKDLWWNNVWRILDDRKYRGQMKKEE